MNGMPPAPLAPPPGPVQGVHLASDQQGFGAPAFGVPGSPVPNPGAARMKVGAVVGAIAVGLAAGALWGGLGPAPAKSPSEVRLESISFAGDSPFMPPVGEDRSGVDAPANTAGTFTGDTPGLFAADENKPSCDTRTLISNLQADPGKAGAWADAVGITAADIPGYVDTLNPVVLRSDTAVTQYGYENGTFVPYPAVLQAGTAAFVNSRGEPRAKCFSGNPLSGTPALENVSYTGPTWNHFTPRTVTYVKPAPVVIKVYVYVDIDRHVSYHGDGKPPWHGDDLSWCDRHPDSDKCDRHHGGGNHDGDDKDHNGGKDDHNGKGDHTNGGDNDHNGGKGDGGKDDQPGKDDPNGQNGDQDGKDGQPGKDKDPKDAQTPPAGPGGEDKKDDKVVDQKNGRPGADDQAKLLTGNGGSTGGSTPPGNTNGGINPPKVDTPPAQNGNPPVQAPIDKLFKGGSGGAGSTGNGGGSGGAAGNGSGSGSTGSGGSGSGAGKAGTGSTGSGPVHVGRAGGTAAGTGTGTGSGTGTGTGAGAGAGTTAGTGTGTGAAAGTGSETGSGEHSGGKHDG